MQLDAFGPDDGQCKMTRNKIAELEREASPSPDESETNIIPILEDSHESSDSPNKSSLSNTMKVGDDWLAMENSFSQ
jgi:hypothetical protein